ncbi:sodium-coupled monocarboxylate transporter 1 [Bradysia coprophila]|uniref:sodium-coupled monocarboxylate transporter 1 n=1 Tax=Bradysia coprophila TaxID=38358 RepID=UPI00187D7166|nr:sodium-coupled monocarboxylate transporter 1 [Bradysia coprophila]XP_037029312.1 sodium-coupled monocarboxylate transporter 1 [Bradysia coprophila]XP_037029313.1 sodium-coupled monocarboxylate transporter 1 [Bradysia coprophila]XP_037029315.1 sodium-coupled monocarboxylate transporter 1 [Bradysia coprophila]
MSSQFSSLIWDYLVFALFIIGSTLYPLWNDIRGRKEKQTKANYVFATGRVSMFAIMLSIARGSLGVRAFIGFPSELYYRGAGMWETIYGLLNAYPLVGWVFLPVYFNLAITSVYQYLDLRFKSRLVRCLASGSFIIRNIFAMGITLYTPSVALNTVGGVPYWITLLGMTAICILFTLLGGLKAAITADVIQGITIIIISIVVIGQGIFESGGIAEVYNINRDNGRLQLFTFTGDLTTRVDTGSAYLGQLFISLSILGCQQNLVQRYLSMKSEKEVKRTLYANVPFIAVLFTLPWIVGMVIYSTYIKCDPLEDGYITKYDEILPFFVHDKLMYIPGCLGLFMAALFNGALCINVSNINSVATVTWEDFLAPLPRFRSMKEKNQLPMIKIVGIVYAFITLGVAFGVGLLSGVIEVAMLTSSITTGPLVGVFLLAVLVPIANWKGAAAGMITSHIITGTFTIGSYIMDLPSQVLTTSTEGCTNTTFSPWITKSEASWLSQTSPVEIGWTDNENSFLLKHETTIPERTPLSSVFGMSYMYYSALGTFVTIFVACIVSKLTYNKEEQCDDKLLNPAVIKLRNYFYKKSQSDVEQNKVNEHDNLGYEIESDTNANSTKATNNINDIESDGITQVDQEALSKSYFDLKPKEVYRQIPE